MLVSLLYRLLFFGVNHSSSCLTYSLHKLLDEMQGIVGASLSSCAHVQLKLQCDMVSELCTATIIVLVCAPISTRTLTSVPSIALRCRDRALVECTWPLPPQQFFVAPHAHEFTLI